MRPDYEVPMQFLRTLFWVMLTVAAVVFSYRNWVKVEIQLWGGIVADAKLPVLLFGAFLLGLVPTYILHRASKWSLKRRADAAERSLAELRGLDPAAPPPPSGTLLPEPAIMPVPPAVS